MKYSPTVSLECPHCETKCQFVQIASGHGYCTGDNLHHISFSCTNCDGIIMTKWSATTQNPTQFESNPQSYNQHLDVYYPLVSDWRPRVNLSLIADEEIRFDFKESIDCYNNELYNACMVMTRRAIQQEMITKKVNGDNLYQQIESTGISSNLKELLKKIKNFGNYGAHPDFCLFDGDGNKIKNNKEFAKLSMEFLDRYFADAYELDSLVKNAPKSEKELNN